MLTVFDQQAMNSIRILFFTAFLIGAHSVRIEENGYKGITISFSQKAQNKFSNLYFEKLKDVLRNASDILFHATRNRSYFEEFIFVTSSTRTNDDGCDEDVSEAPRNVDIYVTDSAEILSLTTQHSKGCGEEGDVIYMPIHWLTGGGTEDLALQFVQRWSTYRYGVFPEDPERPGSCISTSDHSWAPTGCYNIDVKAEVIPDEHGLPVCYFPDDFKYEDLRSSIMFSSNLSKPFHFCDGSGSFPHNPVAPTLHNRLCDGSVWSIIKGTGDFRYSRNLPVKEAKPPTFRCFKESKTHLTLVVQDTDTEARTEIRYALFYFLSNLVAGDLNVSLATFSNDSLTEAMEPVNLDLQNRPKLKSQLSNLLKLNKQVPNICLICGLRKAYEVSSLSQNPLRVVVLFAHTSSLKSTGASSELTEFVQSNDVNGIVLHLILLEDAEDAIPSSLVDAVQNVGGRIFRIKNDRVFVFSQTSLALLDASRNILRREDTFMVVHHEIRETVVSGFRDVFVTPKNMEGKLFYSIQCRNRGEVTSENGGCSILDDQVQSLICENEMDLRNQNSPKTWKYSFDYNAGSEGTTCVSLALLKLDTSSASLFTMNGWLNHNKITPGFNALIIYAEVIGRTDEDVHVEALISGPGLTDYRLELRDNGNGDPDVIKGDRIYSRYFTSFSQKGTYTVSIYAASSVVNANIPKEYSETTGNTVARTKVIGSFRVTEAPPKEDIIPPNRVRDLDVVEINGVHKSALLRWTAPGDNYDEGTANNYTIKLSNHWMSLLDFTFTLKENIQLNLNEYSPSISGTSENLTIQCPVCNHDETYYLALRATDDKDNEGEISNIIQLYFNGTHNPSNDSVEISTDTTNSQTSPISVTDSLTSTLTPSENTEDEEITTTIKTTEATGGIFIEEKIIIIAASTSGVIILLLIIINIIVCYCCFRRGKSSVKQKKISRKDSLRPPYNINMAYRRGSDSSLEEQVASDSTSRVADNTAIFSSPGGRQTRGSNSYTYHTSQSLNKKTDNQSTQRDLGFQLVEPLPAYATSSLSRFAPHKRGTDRDLQSMGSVGLPHVNVHNTQDTQVYPLGEV